ncbi:MAG: class I tRNA ligase family protein, partial [Candidatus Bathyarchaeota archaeon]
RILAVLLAPYTPFSTEKLWQQLNLESSVHEQSWSSLSKLTIPTGHKIGKPSVLFRKIADGEIEKQKQKLQKISAE